MKLYLTRISNGIDDTIGYLQVADSQGVCDFECFTLEDEFRNVKVAGETRIPSGEYNIVFRDEVSPATERYRGKYSFFDKHIMLENVPNFNFIYIHAGVDEGDTDGCILIGDSIISNKTKNGKLGYSSTAFERLYKKVSKALLSGEKVTITITD